MNIPPLANISPLPMKEPQGSEEMKLKKAAKAFEGYFVYMLFKEMQKTTPKGSLFGAGPGGNIYEHLFQQAMADKISSGPNGFGLTRFLMNALEKRKGDSPSEAPPSDGGLPLTKKNEGMPLPPARPFGGEVAHLNILSEMTDTFNVRQNKIERI